MRKGIKTRATVISAKSAFAQTAKRQASPNHVRDDIVHANATRAHFGKNFFFHHPVFGEQISCERRGAGLELLHGIVKAVKFQNRQHRPEDFILHHERVRLHVG